MNEDPFEISPFAINSNEIRQWGGTINLKVHFRGVLRGVLQPTHLEQTGKVKDACQHY